MDRNDVRWCVENCDGGDSLKNETVDEAVEDFLDDLDDLSEYFESLEDRLRHLGLLVVECWVRDEVVANPGGWWADDMLFGFLDQHFSEQMNPDSGTDSDEHITPAMRAAAQSFVSTVVAEFVPWTMHVDSSRNVQINALDWVRLHRPDWLKEGC